jgi:hypothetical protein
VIGTVKNEVTGKPVENAEISIPELDLRALTDRSGMFMIRGIRVRPRPYEVLFKAPSFKTRFESLPFTQKGTRQLEFNLTPLGW